MQAQILEFETDRIYDAGKAKGRAEGIISMGRSHGLSDEVIIEDLMRMLPAEPDEAQAILKAYTIRTQ